MELLLESGAELNVKDDNDKTAFDLACANGNPQVARFLAERIGGLDHWLGGDNSPWDMTCQSTQPELVQSSFRRGEDLPVPGGEEMPSLFDALEEDDLDSVKSLLRHGADPNERDGFHQTPLHIASEKGRHDVAKILIDCDANTNLRDKEGWTPLHWASAHDISTSRAC